MRNYGRLRAFGSNAADDALAKGLVLCHQDLIIPLAIDLRQTTQTNKADSDCKLSVLWASFQLDPLFSACLFVRKGFER